MKRTRRSIWLILIGGMLVALSGCELGTQPLALVRGKVSYKGIPLSSGTIVFTPDALRGTSGAMAVSEIHADGTYVLRTKGSPGATVGWHRVTMMATHLDTAIGPNEDLILPRSLLPEKYRDPELSGLSCQVRSGRENRIDFNLD